MQRRVGYLRRTGVSGPKNMRQLARKSGIGLPFTENDAREKWGFAVKNKGLSRIRHEGIPYASAILARTIQNSIGFAPNGELFRLYGADDPA